ncbi:MAG: cell wall-active antibiotics response protein [Oscillospiraceae bacterium]|jgi:predicted membrane protein|nr:cell wall-active antibiotics response protein [Oscillospiraceae bacterium]
MKKGFNMTFRKKGRWAWGWGIALILIAAVVIADQVGGLPVHAGWNLGFWGAVISVIAVVVFVSCLVELNFASLPIPIAALYYVFQNPLWLPQIDFWPLVLITLLLTVGLHAILPKRSFFKFDKVKIVDTSKNKDDDDDSVVHIIDARDKEDNGESDGGTVKVSGNDNNPRISVQFGYASRYLHADALETVELDCSFGSMQVYFDHVTLNENGATMIANCKFGAIEIYVPSHWRVIDEVTASLGGVEVKGRNKEYAEDAPTIRIKGNVSLGGMEIKRI